MSTFAVIHLRKRKVFRMVLISMFLCENESDQNFHSHWQELVLYAGDIGTGMQSNRPESTNL